MKAITQDRYGSPDVLRLEEVGKPQIGDGQVLVRVRGAGIDPGVWHVMTGVPYLMRIMGLGFRRPRTRVAGTDFAGEVEAVGSDVTRFQPGDEVYGGCRGAFAELACARADKIALKPKNLSFEQAAAVPSSALTALQGLRDKGKLKAGQSALIIGAAGGVGSFAVQIAKALGAEVIGVCSTSKVDLVHSLGADSVIDYTREDLDIGGRHYDVILDTAGNRSLSLLRQALTPRGTLVIVGGEEGGRWLSGIDRQLRALLLSPLVRQNLRPMLAAFGSDDLTFLKGLIEADRVRPVIDRTFQLSEAAEAVRHFERQHARGKIVLTI
ncbi:MAG: NAD(P)-dependent alcohol dehydrogenase [Acidobacteriota bacterium]